MFFHDVPLNGVINMIKQYKIVITYDGTNFSGWMQQIDQVSIAQILEDSFERVYKQSIEIFGASRTDAGVHALGQVAVFKTDVNIDCQKMRWAWNKALPESISILSLEEAEYFSPYHNVVEKQYVYLIFMERPLPFIARYGWEYPYSFEPKKLHEVLRIFIGTHDFHAFYTGNEKGVDTVRTIKDIILEPVPSQNAYRIRVIGEKFMRHMVRRIVGAAMHVAAGKATKDGIIAALAKGGIKPFFPTGPAQGLMLESIRYAS